MLIGSGPSSFSSVASQPSTKSPINRLLTALVGSTFVAFSASAVTISGTASLDELGELQGARISDIRLDQISLSNISESGYSINPAAFQVGLASDGPSARHLLNLDSSEFPRGNYSASGSLATSIRFFSIVLWLVGLAVACVGLFSLSLEKRIGGIESRDLAQQLHSLNLPSAARNISKNWGDKKEATWFVAMGLCAMAAGALN